MGVFVMFMWAKKMNFSPKWLIAIAVFAIVLHSIAAAEAGSEMGYSVQPGSLEYVGAFDLRQIDPELTGADVTIASVCRSITYTDGQPQDDYRINMRHNCFADGKVNFADGIDPDDGISVHATAIGAILIGSDPNGQMDSIANFRYDGASPQAQLDIYEFWHFVRDYIFVGKKLDADILTMSVGTTFEDWWTRGIQRLAEKDGVVIIAGIGNGYEVFDPVLYPAAGGNVIGVGVIDSVDTNSISESLNNFSLARPEHSSVGPTGDMRCKPDIVAPGNCLIPDANGTDGYEVSGDWSSYATPVVAGTVGLLMQKAKGQEELKAAAFGPASNCVMKAIVMNSAVKLPYWHKGELTKEDDYQSPLDRIQGAGMLDAVGAYEQLTAGRFLPDSKSRIGWDNNVIEKNGKAENIYIIELDDPKDKFITATVTWNKHFEDTYPFSSVPKSNDNLRLELWAVDANDPDGTYLLDYSDSENDNVEHIFCKTDPNHFRYEIVVTAGEEFISDPNEPQRYGIAWKAADSDKLDELGWYDLNGNNRVDNGDLAVLLNSLEEYRKSPGEYLFGDINDDGQIDLEDVKVWIDGYSRLK
jgi:hypothetical protein